MDSFAKKVRTFDAFPKVDSEHTVRSQRGGFSTILTMVCGLFILWVEVGGFLGGYVDRQFSVDDEIKSELTINIDMLVAMPCEFIHTNVRDITGDRYLAGETLNFEGRDFFIPESFNVNNANDAHDTPELDEVMQESLRAEYRVTGARMNEGEPACHIFGQIPVNQVKGDFHITGKGFGYRDRLYVPYEALNFSHMIQELSYGEFYPFINNPLDATGKITEERVQSYGYFSKVVPTRYERLGLIIETNQFALTEQHHVFRVDEFDKPEGIPGIYFKYDFEPIKLSISEKRLPFLQFVAKLATIIGGLVIVGGYFYRLYERLLLILFGKKYAQKDTERKSGGLLDKEVGVHREYSS
ncbi:putative ER to golgi transport [Suhomyces tanzawaensis NRRL Y-17324]|uniref:Endoplasmic reticulum-Golgi intermediate compartment protein n=1 Tax=Suhomyces tanzawaensis NRRL Y-17324 TaxID=984487 RepID=A0A1E4SGJ4_9ASCO|nr:putative ER to golgi transport [Suhomyces tanzawaensis NRRL Y-17324]ODV78585.1 putative ER to golgi transport [Suhomyces tanzawaensis NRRL Y-17324]